jgi:hypothetical protein
MNISIVAFTFFLVLIYYILCLFFLFNFAQFHFSVNFVTNFIKSFKILAKLINYYFLHNEFYLYHHDRFA